MCLRCAQLPTDEEKAEEREESGWKLVHADVFRPPQEWPMLFCVLAGTGMQMIICSFLLILFAAIGFLSPANRGSIMIGAYYFKLYIVCTYLLFRCAYVYLYLYFYLYLYVCVHVCLTECAV